MKRGCPLEFGCLKKNLMRSLSKYTAKSFILLFLCCLTFNLHARTAPIHVAFVGPAPSTSSYWKNTMIPMAEAARQLNIKITFHHPSYEQRFNLTPLIEKVLSAKQKPDYLISVFRDINAIKLLTIVEKYRTPFISISTSVSRIEQSKTGKPQQYFKYWLAQITADDISSGRLMAAELYQTSKQVTPEAKVNLLAIGGNKIFEASRLRDLGLQQEVENHQDLAFLQLVHTDWQIDTAKNKSEKLFNRHKKIDAIWTANADIALAVVDVLQQATGIKPPLIGTVDWTKKAFDAIDKNHLSFSLGSNHLHGLWALIMFHDLAHGYQLSAESDQNITTKYLKADKENLTEIRPFLTPSHWKKVDITQYSKVFNQTLKTYDFDFSHMLDKGRK